MNETRAVESAANPYVFVVGCPRSGTTLLRRLLDAHPLIAVPKAETHWIPKFFRKGVGIGKDGTVDRTLIDTLFDYPKFLKLRIEREALEAILRRRPPPDYAAFVSALFDHYGSRQGKPLVGDKTPGYVRFIPLLHDLFPRARFIHLIRDGRDVALSMLNWSRLQKTAARISSFENEPVATTALYWEWLVRLGREAGAELPAGFYLEIGYEALVADTAGQCRRICEFLELPCDDAMLEYHTGKRRDGAGLSAKKAWLPPTQGLRDWRQQMSAAEVAEFEATAGDLLATLGYERTTPAPGPRAARHMRRLRRRFDRRPHPVAWRR